MRVRVHIMTTKDNKRTAIKSQEIPRVVLFVSIRNDVKHATINLKSALLRGSVDTFAWRGCLDAATKALHIQNGGARYSTSFGGSTQVRMFYSWVWSPDLQLIKMFLENLEMRRLFGLLSPVCIF